MKTTEEIISKRMYLNPTIELIKLDNEISLALQSEPPAGPGEPGYIVKAQEYFNNDPLKNGLG